MSFQRQLSSQLRDHPFTAYTGHTRLDRTGPRQVGKTTIARHIQDAVGFPVVYASADSPLPLDATWIETQWRPMVFPWKNFSGRM